MSTHKWMDRVCAAALLLSVVLMAVFMGGEEYSACSVVIDGESYKNVGIRGKGNISLSSVAAMGSSRYSFKTEFDKYDGTKSYHGLDKLSLNNLIQDNTMMKDYLTYRMMGEFGVAAPLCSFVYITVNGEDWGLYLAVEGVEEAFLRRNYGSDYGELYKPDSMSFGGGRLDIPAYPARRVGADTSCRVVDRVQIQEVVICTKRLWNLKFRGLFCLRMFPKHETVTENF